MILTTGVNHASLTGNAFGPIVSRARKAPTMNEDMILAIKWLESDEGETWSRKRHARVWRPLVTVVRDGDASSLMGEWQMLWLA
jgi:hypothetical protein